MVWPWAPWSPVSPGLFVLARYWCRYQLLYALSTLQGASFLIWLNLPKGLILLKNCGTRMHAAVPRVRANMNVSEKTSGCLKNPWGSHLIFLRGKVHSDGSSALCWCHREEKDLSDLVHCKRTIQSNCNQTVVNTPLLSYYWTFLYITWNVVLCLCSCAANLNSRVRKGQLRSEGNLVSSNTTYS